MCEGLHGTNSFMQSRKFRTNTAVHVCQVSFGVHDEEERAGRMYDRAIIVERGRGAKTNFPLHDYEQEIADFEAFVEARCDLQPFTIPLG